jgi:4-aminobutyrate aminotransferase-like enzyme
MLVGPEGYLRAVFDKVRAAGGLCVADEVQAGFGRPGTHMWGFEAHGAMPDIVTMGKPIANGHPVGVVVTTPEILRAFTADESFFSTFGGNTVACAAALATLDVLEREGLQQNARVVGDHMREAMRGLMDRHSLIGDVRGRGQLTGVELVRDRASLEPAAAETKRVMNLMREFGVLVGREGPHENVLKIRPPLCLNSEQADMVVEALDRALAGA